MCVTAGKPRKKEKKDFFIICRTQFLIQTERESLKKNFP